MNKLGRHICVLIGIAITIFAYFAARQGKYDLAWQFSSLAVVFPTFAYVAWWIEENKK